MTDVEAIPVAVPDPMGTLEEKARNALAVEDAADVATKSFEEFETRSLLENTEIEEKGAEDASSDESGDVVADTPACSENVDVVDVSPVKATDEPAEVAEVETLTNGDVMAKTEAETEAPEPIDEAVDGSAIKPVVEEESVTEFIIEEVAEDEIPTVDESVDSEKKDVIEELSLAQEPVAAAATDQAKEQEDETGATTTPVETTVPEPVETPKEESVSTEPVTFSAEATEEEDAILEPTTSHESAQSEDVAEDASKEDEPTEVEELAQDEELANAEDNAKDEEILKDEEPTETDVSPSEPIPESVAAADAVEEEVETLEETKVDAATDAATDDAAKELASSPDQEPEDVAEVEVAKTYELSHAHENDEVEVDQPTEAEIAAAIETNDVEGSTPEVEAAADAAESVEAETTIDTTSVASAPAPTESEPESIDSIPTETLSSSAVLEEQTAISIPSDIEAKAGEEPEEEPETPAASTEDLAAGPALSSSALAPAADEIAEAQDEPSAEFVADALEENEVDTKASEDADVEHIEKVAFEPTDVAAPGDAPVDSAVEVEEKVSLLPAGVSLGDVAPIGETVACALNETDEVTSEAPAEDAVEMADVDTEETTATLPPADIQDETLASAVEEVVPAKDDIADPEAESVVANAEADGLDSTEALTPAVDVPSDDLVAEVPEEAATDALADVSVAEDIEQVSAPGPAEAVPELTEEVAIEDDAPRRLVESPPAPEEIVDAIEHVETSTEAFAEANDASVDVVTAVEEATSVEPELKEPVAEEELQVEPEQTLAEIQPEETIELNPIDVSETVSTAEPSAEPKSDVTEDVVEELGISSEDAEEPAPIVEPASEPTEQIMIVDATVDAMETPAEEVLTSASEIVEDAPLVGATELIPEIVKDANAAGTDEHVLYATSEPAELEKSEAETTIEAPGEESIEQDLKAETAQEVTVLEEASEAEVMVKDETVEESVLTASTIPEDFADIEHEIPTSTAETEVQEPFEERVAVVTEAFEVSQDLENVVGGSVSVDEHIKLVEEDSESVAAPGDEVKFTAEREDEDKGDVAGDHVPSTVQHAALTELVEDPGHQESDLIEAEEPVSLVVEEPEAVQTDERTIDAKPEVVTIEGLFSKEIPTTLSELSVPDVHVELPTPSTKLFELDEDVLGDEAPDISLERRFAAAIGVSPEQFTLPMQESSEPIASEEDSVAPTEAKEVQLQVSDDEAKKDVLSEEEVPEKPYEMSSTEEQEEKTDVVTSAASLSVGPKVTDAPERPKSPWTPSYSVTTQGPGISDPSMDTDEEDVAEDISESKLGKTSIVDHAQATREGQVNSVVEEAMPSASKSEQQQQEAENVLITAPQDAFDTEEPNDSTEVERPKSPYPPSYSVTQMGPGEPDEPQDSEAGVDDSEADLQASNVSENSLSLQLGVPSSGNELVDGVVSEASSNVPEAPLSPRSDLGILTPGFDTRSEVSDASHEPIAPNSPRGDPDGTSLADSDIKTPIVIGSKVETSEQGLPVDALITPLQTPLLLTAQNSTTEHEFAESGDETFSALTEAANSAFGDVESNFLGSTSGSWVQGNRHGRLLS
ncbi:hypothetical protein DFH11DRAFT_854178 [Phellopilus nigrolimitatus]|nr:hypothetical protein DFH11DRAFT_854178 [Phellopilus nigrolimitatus]